jgi:hypothetical protein
MTLCVLAVGKLFITIANNTIEIEKTSAFSPSKGNKPLQISGAL